VDKGTQTRPVTDNYVDALTQTNDEVVEPQKEEDTLAYVPRSNTIQKAFPNNTANLRRGSNDERTESIASGAGGPSWKRSKLPWELPKETVEQCPVAPGDHGINDVCFEAHAVEDESAECSTVSDEGSCHTATQVLSSRPCPPNLLPPKCQDCVALVDSTNENLDGQVQSHSHPEQGHTHGNVEQSFALCQPCSKSVYTAYVIPPNRDCILGHTDPRSPSYHAHRKHHRQPGPALMDTEEAPEKPAEVLPESFSKKSRHKTKNRLDGDHHKHIFRDPVKRPSEPQIDPSDTISNRGTDPEENNLQSAHRTSHYRHRPHLQRHGNPTGHMTSVSPLVGPRHLPCAPISTSTLSTSLPHKAYKTTNQKIFHGLQVATAAACDKDLDAWLMEVNGTGVRQFLADLGKFESLGVNALSNVAKRAARDRREQVRQWERVGEERMKKSGENRSDGYGDHGKRAGGELNHQTSGMKEVDEGNWVLGGDGIKKGDKGGYSLGKEGIVKDE
jgi:hypothetical protein